MLDFLKKTNKKTPAQNTAPVLFVHIPKTAGTSFRISLAKELGEKSILWDYGSHSEHTSELIKHIVYQQESVSELLNKANNIQLKAIAGHFQAKKYIPPIELENVISFVREPSARTLSNFRHHQREFNYSGTLAEYLQNPGAQNMMTRYFNSIPWPMFGFIGVAEDYDDSLEILNQKFNWTLKQQELNKAPATQIKNTQPTTDEQKLLKSANSKDHALYNKVVNLFNWQKRLAQKNQPFTRGYWRYRPKHGDVIGSAATDNGVPVKLSVSIGSQDNIEQGLIVANKPPKAVIQKQASEQSIHFRLPDVSGAQVNKLKVVNADTGQPIVRI